MLRTLVLAFALALGAAPLAAQDLETVIADNADEIAAPSRRSVGEVIDALVATEDDRLPAFLEVWEGRDLWQRESDGAFFTVEGGGPYDLSDPLTGAAAGTAARGEIKNLKPNAGVRGVIRTALVRFQLLDDDIGRRTAALDAIARRPDADQLEPLAQSIEDEPDPGLRARKERLVGILTARFGATTDARVAAIEDLSDDVSLDVRAVMNQILTTTRHVGTAVPDADNVARELRPGADMTVDEAYDLLVDEGLARATVSDDATKATLVANAADGEVGGVPVATLNTDAARIQAYRALVEAGQADPFLTEEERATAVDAHAFWVTYDEPDAAVTEAAEAGLRGVQTRVGLMQAADLGLDALSLASIYFLAAIGLAITFGVMRVINMAHGEFIMMGAYTGYVVQQWIPNYTAALAVALPLAFIVTFGAGVAMERLVIRHLYKRPLETLLATFGISIALQQLAKNIFGTQARPLTSPDWLGGALTFNDVVSIAYIRIAIFVLALIFLGLILWILLRTRVGLEVRAVTQNPGMAASMGINPDRINMLTFGLGSGVAGIAGIAIGLYAQVTSEMGANYIVQSFMTVVVGGVGNVWGTLAGATLIGGFQKGVEFLNPSNTLAAQTYMILFIILFIQFRPKGIVALKGRAAGD